MKKKILMCLGIIGLAFCLTGCFSEDELHGSKITTTVYPIEFLVDKLYNNGKIDSIYPNDDEIGDYTLSDKQIKNFAKETNLFVYNGLTDEKNTAKKLLNKNKKIQIIDVSYGLKYHYGIEELWLNPNNFLMLATTLKDNLEELSANKYAADEIEKNYISLEEDLSTLDTEIRALARTAAVNNMNTIVIAYDSFQFLEEYGFDVVNISDENNITTSIKNKFKAQNYKYILVKNTESIPDGVKDLVDNYNAVLVEIETMETLTDAQRNSNETYLTIMNDFIENLSSVTVNQS